MDIETINEEAIGDVLWRVSLFRGNNRTMLAYLWARDANMAEEYAYEETQGRFDNGDELVIENVETGVEVSLTMEGSTQ